MSSKRPQKPASPPKELAYPTPLEHITHALAALEIGQQALARASKLLEDDNTIGAYMRTALMDFNCARGRLVFLQERLAQQEKKS